MHCFRIILAFLVGTFSTTAVFAHKDHQRGGANERGSLVPAKDAPPEWVAKAKAEYPTNQCVVSDDELGGDMGAPHDYVYKEEGKPDRLVRLCCKDCVKDFKKDPAKYISAIDKAGTTKRPAGKQEDQSSHHSH